MTGAEGRKTAAGGSVLRRHIAARASARPADATLDDAAPAPVPAARTPERSVAAAIARAAERAHGMPMFFDKVTTGHAVVAELGDLFPEHALICVVEAGGDRIGAVAICPGLLTSLIEIQALGRISSRPAVPRRPTRTDAAISAEFLDACLTELGVELASHTGFEGLAGYRYASFLDDPRPLELMLDDSTYRLISVAFRAGPAGQRDGRMVFVLPAQASRTVLAPPGNDEAEPAPPPAEDAGVLAAQLQDVPIDLFGILCRRAITLGELQALGPGDRIALPPGSLAQATLETPSGQLLARGRLGALAGRHALRIAPLWAASQAPDDGAARGLAGAAIPDGQAGFAGLDPAPGADFDLSRGIADLLDEASPLAEPDIFRPEDTPAVKAMAALDTPASLSGWDDADEPTPLAPLAMQIG